MSRWVDGMQAAVLWTALAAPAGAAAPALSGFWKLEAPAAPRKPALTTRGSAEAAETAKLVKDGDSWCVTKGMPHVMNDAGPLDIIQGGDEIVILTEVLGTPRHIYLDRSKHLSEDVFDNTRVGDSVGHYTSDGLVVDTAGFAAGDGPFGAPRTERSHVMETFKLKGDRLTITSTWTDPGIYSKPFTYTLVYDRLPTAYAPQESSCDPRKNGKFLPGNLR